MGSASRRLDGFLSLVSAPHRRACGFVRLVPREFYECPASDAWVIRKYLKNSKMPQQVKALLPPSLTTWVYASEPTWWKEKISSRKSVHITAIYDLWLARVLAHTHMHACTRACLQTCIHVPTYTHKEC